MSYSSVLISVPGATAWVIIGLIVACCTLGSMCRITGPPRWISPRTGGFSFSSVPRPGAPGSLRHRPERPFLPPRPVGPCARPRCRLHRSQRCRPASRRERVPPTPGGDARSSAQNPHAQWLMVPGQHRAGQIVEASMAGLAQVALPVPLSVVMAIADDHGTVAVRAAHAIRPTMLTHKLKTLGLVQQPREIDHLRYRHACAASSSNRITSSSDQIRDLASALPLQSHHPGTQQEPPDLVALGQQWSSPLLSVTVLVGPPRSEALTYA